MKKLLLTLLAIGCVAFLYLGNMYWKEKTTLVASEEKTTKTIETSPSEETPAPQKEATEEEGKKDLDSLTSNWPEEARTHFIELVKNGESFKLAIVGSPAMGEDENGWAPQLKEKLLSELGSQVEVEIFQSDVTSIEFINGEESDNVLAFEPDLVLLEPFSLKDNSNQVGTVQNHESILMFLREMKETNEDSVLLLQPPHPLEGATYYPQQIEALKEFAGEESISYLDHWDSWPDDETLSDYLIDSQDTPNEKGHEIWADYLIEYFINESSESS
ncbi:SGNH/GDSL hydrolase family protein [Rossellomorea vietnamensis]|uniref:SGNH/GDSL hydrolase family protein n=1 Tax=Rossellomorea vietnamensis TaxID=218284 RepID=A0A0P6W0U1_9BACI|nr:SGNH/GDSL hydrolase family protein [Rossellomorea vietnamensis]KPL59287.1 hypothetical protein AM506_12260 [Rossellomorea vietnamensis]